MPRHYEDKSAAVLDYLNEFIRDNGYPPSVRDICKACGIKSTATTYYLLNKLEDAGKIKKSPSINRGLSLASRPNLNSTVNIPLVGKIAAGTPILATENIEETFNFPTGLFKSGELFMLNVSGDSMKNVGIMNGDQIVVRKQNTAENGEIAAVLVNGDATVKRVFSENGHVRLQPENDLMEPIIVEEADILGIVVGLLRSYK